MACIRMSLRSRVLDVDTVVNVVIPYDHFDREGRQSPSRARCICCMDCAKMPTPGSA